MKLVRLIRKMRGHILIRIAAAGQTGQYRLILFMQLHQNLLVHLGPTAHALLNTVEDIA